VELFEELRREYEFGVGSIAGVARKFGVHRRLVREALGCAIPQERLSKGRPRPKTGAVAEFIEHERAANTRSSAITRRTLGYRAVPEHLAKARSSEDRSAQVSNATCSNAIVSDAECPRLPSPLHNARASWLREANN
jgi:hypothetical protein